MGSHLLSDSSCRPQFVMLSGFHTMTNTPAATRATPHAVDQFASRLSGFAIASTADAATCMAFRAGFVSTNDI